MNRLYKKISYLLLIPVAGLLAVSCQKMDRPALGDYPEDPKAPALQVLGAQSYFPFDHNIKDTGEFKFVAKAKNISYAPGVAAVPEVTGGEAALIGDKGYVAVFDTKNKLDNPGSFTVAFWMKGAKGPVDGGAQGLFAISNSQQFWANLEIFLENYKDPDDPNAAFIKMHLLNANVTGGGEVWLAGDEVKVKNVLNKWTHIALTYDGSTSKVTLYKDGQPTALNGMVLGGGNYGNIKWDNVTGMVIGSFAFMTSPTLANHGAETWAKSFNGALDQVRFYTKPLSAAEVKNLYDNKL